MKAKCSQCLKDYKELDEDEFIFIENDCPMICYDCVRFDRTNQANQETTQKNNQK